MDPPIPRASMLADGPGFSISKLSFGCKTFGAVLLIFLAFGATYNNKVRNNRS